MVALFFLACEILFLIMMIVVWISDRNNQVVFWSCLILSNLFGIGFQVIKRLDKIGGQR